MTGALETVIAAPGGSLRLFNIHLGDASREERLLQIEHLMGLLRYSPREGGVWNGVEADPVHWQSDDPLPLPPGAILLGDFNAAPGSPEYVAVTRGPRPASLASDAAAGDHPAFVDS